MTHIHHISRTTLWAICKLFFIFYIIVGVLSIPPLVLDLNPMTSAILVWILILAPIAVLARPAYIRLER